MQKPHLGFILTPQNPSKSLQNRLFGPFSAVFCPFFAVFFHFFPQISDAAAPE
jgi:hypothetical protein